MSPSPSLRKKNSMPKILTPSGVRASNKREFIIFFKQDHNTLKAMVVNHIYDMIKGSVSKGKTSIRVWNVNRLHNNKRLPLSNMKPSTFFTGTWDPVRETHSKSLFEEAGLLPMLDTVIHTFKEKGYTVKDVSDKNLSNSMVLLVEWGDEEEDGGDCLSELGA